LQNIINDRAVKKKENQLPIEEQKSMQNFSYHLEGEDN
jgi:hypothetical protein